MSRLLDTKVGEIKDEEIRSLIQELEEVCHVSSQQSANLPLQLFFQRCVYPEGPQKHIPITTKFVPLAQHLESRVGMLSDGPLRELCAELALRAKNALEFYSDRRVYMLLNKAFPKKPSAKNPTKTQQRWDVVVNRRRSNRG
ncbi:MAG: hypothetical protein WDN28_16990 [Chthoniobacter sp.]